MSASIGTGPLIASASAVVVALIGVIAAIVRQTRELFAGREQTDRADRREAFDAALGALVAARRPNIECDAELVRRLDALERAAQQIEIRTDPLNYLARAFRACQKEILDELGRPLPARAAYTLADFEQRGRHPRRQYETAVDRFIRLVHADQAQLAARSDM